MTHEPQPKLQLDRDTGAPLYSQLRDGLADWLAARPDGARVPSERKLADMMGVNRRTLHRAVAELEEQGALVREGRRLFVKHLEAAADLVPHAFVEQAASTSRDAATLTIAVYENLPWQQACWTKIVDGYNARSDQQRLEVRWVPMSVNTDTRYLQYLTENPCDLALAPTGTLASLGRSGALSRLPMPLREQLLEPDYLLGDFGSHSPTVYDFGAPLHFCIWVCLVNEELVVRPPTTGPMSPLELAEWMASQVPLLPADTALLSAPSEFLNLVAHPGIPMPRAVLRQMMGLHYDILSRFAPEQAHVTEPMVEPGNYSAIDGARTFAEGRSAYYIGPSYYVLGLLKASRFPWHQVHVLPPAGYHRGMSSTSIGISSSCHDIAAAEDAVSYLLSTDAQAEIARHAVNCPIRRDALPLLSQYLNPRGSTALRDLVATYRLKSAMADEFENFVRHAVWPPLATVALNGGGDREQAVIAAVERCVSNRQHYVSD